jgi:hypothetical protein
LGDYITFHTRKRLFAGSLDSSFETPDEQGKQRKPFEAPFETSFETQGKQGKRVRHPKLQTRPLLVAERLSYEKNRTLETEGCGTQPPTRSGVNGGDFGFRAVFGAIR